jgi:hypothetical protein
MQIIHKFVGTVVEAVKSQLSQAKQFVAVQAVEHAVVEASAALLAFKTYPVLHEP